MDINHKKAKEYFDNGNKFYQEEKFKDAESCFEKALLLVPDRLSVIENLILTYIERKNLDGISNLLKKVDHLKDNKEIQFGLAFREYFNKNYKLSIKLSKDIIQNFLHYEERAQTLLVLNYYYQYDFLNSLKILKKLLKKKKDFFAYYNIGLILFRCGKIKKSFFYLKKSIELKNNNFEALWNFSLCCLTLSKFEIGFQLYDNRFKIKEALEKKYQFISELKSLENIFNKKILIWDEQGLGDTLNFSRFIIKLLDYTEHIDLVVNNKLTKLLTYLNKNIKIINEQEVTKYQYDYQLSLLSIPALLKIKNIKELESPKINFQFKDINIFSNEINSKDFNVGLCWFGNPEFLNDKYRSLNLSIFEDILSIQKIKFFKLGKGLNLKDKIVYHQFNFVDLGNKDFYELSYFLPYLDFIASTDTSIIHLCGVLGIKATLLLNYNADWRWFFDDKKTVWYPSIEILRCKRINEWKPVLEKLKTKIIEAQKIKFNNS